MMRVEFMRRAQQDSLNRRKRLESVDDAQRFEFGRNWKRFLHLVDEERIGLAQRSLQTMLGWDRLKFN